ncbi:MAG: hypothetical protein N4A57_07030 [Anaeromicrobium sp.]|jgi:hypothetical protein|uniref:hypothetical protein n=1 Tax=Anaeromicrobium sp. TaxID=1929132 RepID=UPI0025FF6BCF|nr:hypothetical protein [Anaeromicrobium sp.]MCT4594002.1 hypothetical protein [Anaeromicrobium sp.]
MNINTFSKVIYKEVGTFTCIDDIYYDNYRICTEFAKGKVYKHKIKKSYTISIDNSKYKDIPMEKTSLVGNCIFHTKDKDLILYNDKIENWTYKFGITREYKKSILEGITFVNGILDKVYHIDYVKMQKINYCAGLYETKYYEQIGDNVNRSEPLFINAILVDIYNRYNETSYSSIEEVFAHKNFWNVITNLKKFEGISLGVQLKLEGSDEVYKEYPWYSLLKDMTLPKVTIELLNDNKTN